MKFTVVCYEEVSTEFIVDVPSREALDKWLEEEGPNTVSFLTARQTVHDRDYEITELKDKKRCAAVEVDVHVNGASKPEKKPLLEDKEGFAKRVNDGHARLAAQIQGRPTGGDVRKILTETPSMKAEDPNVIIQNCYIKAREGDEGFHLKSPLVIDGYAIIPLEMIVPFAEILKGVT